MKARLLRHFKTKDPVIAIIVANSEQYALGTASQGSAFEALARSIAGQQISGLVARRILERLVALHGGRFPTPAELAAATPDALRGVGFSYSKVAALQDLAAHCLDGRVPDDATLAALDDEAIIERCTAVRGIGRWTVQMLLMFHFGRHDVLPVDDFGVRNGFRLAYGLKGMPRPKALLAYGERWKPFRSAAAWYMWRAVDLHQQGRLPRRTGRAPRIEVMPPKPKEKAKAKAKAKPATRAKKTVKVRKRVRKKAGAAGKRG
jgi:DNA-3-methyladenine glycosylase II